MATEPPVVIPKGATRRQELELAFPAIPPPPGTKARAEYDVLVAKSKRGMDGLVRSMRRR